MRLLDPKVWIGVVSLALVLILFFLDFGRTSPGPLIEAHGRIASLAAADGCDQCHGGWMQSLGDACLECHVEIEVQLASGAGVHGAQLERESGREGVDRCATCHGEHLGPEFDPLGERAFELAGFSGRASFDHGHVEFPLTGRHDELACVDCHLAAEVEVLAEGQTRFLGLTSDCAGCHDDPHEGRFARGCQTCHDQEHPFGEVASFEHGASFPLRGAHARPTCAECHAPAGPHAIEALAGHAPPPPARLCADCHDSPHADAFTASVAERVDGATCAACHDAERGPFEHDVQGFEPELHEASGFALDAPHEGLACAACHDEGSGPFAERFPGRRADDCAACHADPHGGQFVTADGAPRGCVECHAREGFTPVHFGVQAHAGARFPLEGSHAAVACAECHELAAGARRFVGTPRDCRACHPDPHRLTLGSSFAPGARAGCAECHLPTVFAEVERASFDHGASAAFALEGAHADLECARCHPAQAEPEPDGRRFGRAADLFGAPLDRCASCHTDAHRGAFDDARFAHLTPDEEGCERCHVVAGFRAGPAADFDHEAWTGFALDGAHARADCASCHGEPPPAWGEPVAATRSFGFLRPRLQPGAVSCAACHEDPHGGRFDLSEEARGAAPFASCGRCHTTESFAEPAGPGFDHGRDAGHALVGAHARAACESCHVPGRGVAPGAVRLGRAIGSACADCHADPHAGQFARGGRSDCAACHLEDGGFTALDFDHARDARFALDEQHRALACAACHVPWPLADGRRVVRYKPLGTRCIDCHDHGGGR